MNYVTSKDYEQLWNLVQEGKEVVCFISTGTLNEVPRLVTQEVCIGRTKAVFIDEVRKLNLQFLPPNTWIKIESDNDFPQPRQWVLVTDGKEICHVFWNGEAWDDDRYFYNRKTFTYWKPLPEPPRE